MLDAEIAKEVFKACSVLKQEDNAKEMDYWVAEANDSQEGGFFLSAIKGRKAHLILNQNGDLISHPTGRNRSGFWTDGILHLAGFTSKAGAYTSDKIFSKYVRSFGYIYREYTSHKRIDYVPTDRGYMKVIIVPLDGNAVNISLKIAHMESWPSRSKGKQYSSDVHCSKVVVESEVASTYVSVIGECNLSSDKNEQGVNIDISIRGETEIVISDEDYTQMPNELEKTIKENSSVKNTSILKTPDFKLNKVFLWSKHDILELFSEGKIGSGFYAGMPGFSWFFGRDGEWISQAAIESGMSDLAEKHLELLWKYSSNGRIPHELPLTYDEGDYEYRIGDDKLSTRFMSIDSSPLWIMNHIHHSNWTGTPMQSERISKILGFLESCDIDGDGLLENQFKKGLIGWVEEWAIDRDGKCVDVNAQWIQALRMVQEKMEGPGKSWKELLSMYQKTFINSGKDGTVIYDNVNNGSSKSTKTPMNLIPLIYFSEELGDAAKEIIAELSGPGMKVPWGIRSLSSDDSIFSDGYHTGMVWPLMTGWASLAAFAVGSIPLGTELMNTFVKLAYNSPDPGRIGEVYSSSDCRETGQFFQGWSSSLLVTCVTEGLFGMNLNVMGREDWMRHVKSSLPPEWGEIKLEKVVKNGRYYRIACDSTGCMVEDMGAA